MKVSMKPGEKGSFKPPFLMLTVLGIHVAAAGFFMMMSGCSTTKQSNIEPPPAPIMPPSSRVDTVEPAPRPSFRAPKPVTPPASSVDAAGSSSYTIQKGDSLSKIAVRAGVSAKEIAQLNNIKDPNKIRIGQKILIPAHGKALRSPPPKKKAAPKKKKAAAKKPSAPAVDSGDTHVVESGDSLGKLAIRYGTSVSAFKSVNNLKSDMIRIGQKLKIPKGTKSSAPAAKPESGS